MNDNIGRDVLLAVLAGLGAFALLVVGVLAAGVWLLLAGPQPTAQPVAVAVATEAAPTDTPTSVPAVTTVALTLTLVVAPQDTPTVAPLDTPTPAPTATPTFTPLPPSATPAPTMTPTLAAILPVFQSGGLGQPRTWWEERFGPQIEVYGMPGYGDFNVLFMPGDRAGHIERQFKPEITLEAAQAMAASLLPSDAQFVEHYSPEGRPETLVDVYQSASLAQNYPDASEWEYYPPGQFIVLYNAFEPGVARFVVALGNNP